MFRCEFRYKRMVSSLIPFARVDMVVRWNTNGEEIELSNAKARSYSCKTLCVSRLNYRLGSGIKYILNKIYIYIILCGVPLCACKYYSVHFY